MKNHNIKNLFLVFFFSIIPIQLLSCQEHIEQDNYEWQITFEDDFNFFDSTKWSTLLKTGHRTIWTNNELQWYQDENVHVEDGVLKLVTREESVFGKDVQGEKLSQYSSGLISNKNFTQVYGKWEMRVKFPFRKGFWPAFWLLADHVPTLPEIDIFEYFGVEENKISVAHHWGIDYPNWGGDYKGTGEPFYNVRGKQIEGKFSDVWMVWSFECFPDKMVWKLNDKIVFETSEGIPTSPLYLIANVAVKEFPENNNEVGDSSTPYLMEIDYIRVYQMVPINK